MPPGSAIAAASLGAGVTLASTFAPSLGLTVHQQRVGFAAGVLLLVVGALLYLAHRNESDGHKSKNVEKPNALPTVNVTSHHQSGGITAHTVNLAQERPRLETSIEGDRQFRDGYFVTTVLLELRGHPKRMGLSAESAGSVHDLILRKDGSAEPLADVRIRRTEGEGVIQSCGNPQPGRYIAEILTESDIHGLHIEPWLE